MTSTETETETDWNQIVSGAGGATAPAAPAPHAPAQPAANNLPPFPQDMKLLFGRVPIRCDTRTAIVQLPEPIEDLNCALVWVNSGVKTACGHRPSKRPYPNALSGRPINDQEIEVRTDSDGDGRVVEPGWTTGAYPGAGPTTRGVDADQPYVEVLVALLGSACGDKWVSCGGAPGYP